MKMENIVLSFVIFGGLVSLLVMIQSSLSDTYSVVDTDPVGIMTELDGLLLVQSMNETVSFIYTMSDPTASTTDIIGSLMISGVGVLKSMLGVVTFVPEILFIVVKYYPIPGIIVSMFVVMFVVSVGFILLRSRMRGDA